MADTGRLWGGEDGILCPECDRDYTVSTDPDGGMLCASCGFVWQVESKAAAVPIQEDLRSQGVSSAVQQENLRRFLLQQRRRVWPE